MHSNWQNFFQNLSQNNNRQWFQAHRDEYKRIRDEFHNDLTRLLACMSQYEPAFSRLDARDLIYRVNRDIRFSPDKSPYKTYISASIAPLGRKSPEAGYYIHADCRPGESGLFGGLWHPENANLKKLRKAIADNFEEFEEIVNAPGLTEYFPEWCGETLKTAPQGYPKDHPAIYWLRMKDIGKFHAVTPSFFADPCWPEKAAKILRHLYPLLRFINYSLFEE